MSEPPAAAGPPKRAIPLKVWVLLALLCGGVVGLGLYTSAYAEGASYLSDDPKACRNCHIMNDVYDAWERGPHHAVATCNDCHGNHLVLPHTDTASTISARNIAATCTRCHARIEEVHTKIIKGELWEKKAGAIPSCTDCHHPHRIKRTSLVAGTSDRECLKCHEKPDLQKAVQGEPVSMTVAKEDLQISSHRDIPCVKCHSDIDPQRKRPCETVARVDCSNCHQVAEDYFASDHGQAYVEKNSKSYELARLRQLGVLPDALALAVRDARQVQARGVDLRGTMELPVVLRDQPKVMQDLALLPVRGPEGRVFRLGELAEVRQEEDTRGRFNRFNGQTAVSLSVSRLAGSDAIQTAARVKDEMARMRPSLPPGLRFHLEWDESKELGEELKAARAAVKAEAAKCTDIDALNRALEILIEAIPTDQR